MNDYIRKQDERIQYFVDYMDGAGLLEDHTFTFPDGVTYSATEADEEG